MSISTLDNDELIDRVAEKTGLPRQQVENMVFDLWAGVRQRAARPETAKGGFRLGKYFRLDLNYFHILNYLERIDSGVIRRKRNPKLTNKTGGASWRKVLAYMEKHMKKYRTAKARRLNKVSNQSNSDNGDHQG